MRAFSLKIYKFLLEEFVKNGYSIYFFESFLSLKIISEKFLILRHDVDKKQLNSLAKAQIEMSGKS